MAEDSYGCGPTIPIPLRPGVVAQIKIPHDLTKAEAEKIARVVVALAVPVGDDL